MSTAAPHTITRVRQLALLSVWALAISVLWNSVHPLLLPIIVASQVPAELKNTVLGAMTFVGLIVALIIQPVAGEVSDRAATRWGRRRPFIVVFSILSAAMLFALAGAPALPLLIVAYVTLQVIFNFALGPYQALIPDLVPSERRGAASGAKNLAEVLGLIIATLGVSLLVTTTETLPAFAAIAVTLLAATAITVLGVRENPEPARRHPWRRTLLAVFFDPRRHPNFAWMITGRLLFVIGMTTIQSFALFYIEDVLRPEDPVAAWRLLGGGIAVAILVFTYPAGVIADRIGRRIVVLVAGLIAGAGSLLMLLATDAGGVLGFGLFVGIGIGLFLSANWALATDLVPANEAARFMGLTNLATAGGAALARLNGPLIDAVNTIEPLLGYRAMLVLVAVAFLAGGALVLRVREPGRGALIAAAR